VPLPADKPGAMRLASYLWSVVPPPPSHGGTNKITRPSTQASLLPTDLSFDWDVLDEAEAAAVAKTTLQNTVEGLRHKVVTLHSCALEANSLLASVARRSRRRRIRRDIVKQELRISLGQAIAQAWLVVAHAFG